MGHIDIDVDSLVFSLTDKYIIDQRFNDDVSCLDVCVGSCTAAVPLVQSLVAAVTDCHSRVASLLAGNHPCDDVTFSDIDDHIFSEESGFDNCHGDVFDRLVYLLVPILRSHFHKYYARLQPDRALFCHQSNRAPIVFVRLACFRSHQ